MYLISDTLEHCFNSYTNNITDIIDNYNDKNGITELKSCITKKDDRYIINPRYNPNSIYGHLVVKGGVIQNIELNGDFYTSPSLADKLNLLFRGYVLKKSNGEVI